MHEQICDQAFDAGDCSRWRWSRHPSSPQVYAAPDESPPPPPSSSNKKKKSSEVKPGIEDTAFAKGIARPTPRSMTAATMLSAITQLKALGRDDSAAVANLIGYSYRKLGDYKVVADLVRARAEGRSHPRQDLAVLRPVAGRTGQPRAGAVSPEPDRSLDRHRQRGISLAGRGAGTAAGQRASSTDPRDAPSAGATVRRLRRLCLVR